jgi:hypothetical protein
LQRFLSERTAGSVIGGPQGRERIEPGSLARIQRGNCPSMSIVRLLYLADQMGIVL